jgi:hypothetical protein
MVFDPLVPESLTVRCVETRLTQGFKKQDPERPFSAMGEDPRVQRAFIAMLPLHHVVPLSDVVKFRPLFPECENRLNVRAVYHLRGLVCMVCETSQALGCPSPPGLICIDPLRWHQDDPYPLVPELGALKMGDTLTKGISTLAC